MNEAREAPTCPSCASPLPEAGGPCPACGLTALAPRPEPREPPDESSPPGPLLTLPNASIETDNAKRRMRVVHCGALLGLIFALTCGLGGLVAGLFTGGETLGMGIILIVCSPLVALFGAVGLSTLSFVWDAFFNSLAFLNNPTARRLHRQVHAYEESDEDDEESDPFAPEPEEADDATPPDADTRFQPEDS